MLKDLLAKTRLYHPSYGGGLCNHAPMALIALERLGGPPARLRAFAETALEGMEPAPESGSGIDATNWRERLGEEAAYADYLDFFRREVARLNGRAALRAYLPELIPGLAAAAFHPMIRTAFGVIAEDDGEIAVGLAYWASRYLALPSTDAPMDGPMGRPVDEPMDGAEPEVDPWLLTTEDPIVLLRRLREQGDLEYLPDPDNLIDRELAGAAAHSRFLGIVHSLAIDALTFGRLRHAAALLYLAAENFSSLHGVTGLQAAGILGDFTPDRRGFAAAAWRALLALYLSLGRPELPGADAVSALAAALPDWNTILPAAVASDDDHVIKLVYACLAESRAGGGRIYRLLAARKAGLAGAAGPDSFQPGSFQPDGFPAAMPPPQPSPENGGSGGISSDGGATESQSGAPPAAAAP